VFKILAVVILGFVYTISTVAFPVLFLRGAQGTLAKATPPKAPKRGKAPKVPKPSAPPKPYADETMSRLFKGTVATAILSLAATKMGNELATPLQSIFLCVGTFATYVWGARLPAGFNKVVHPLITSTALTIGIIFLTGKATGSEFIDVLKTYKTGTLDLMKTGAGDVLLFLLGPSVVSFGVAIYGKKKLLKENFFIVMAAMLISSGGGLFGTAAFIRAIQLGGSNGRMVRLSVISRNVTTALSMAIAGILGGDLSIAASVVVLTGIIGATYGRRILDAFGIKDPITRGLAIGASSQGLGVSSLVGEPDAFPFAAMSMVLTAVCATVLVSIPPIKDALIKLSIGA
jgi:putative effector of murein hydrolase